LEGDSVHIDEKADFYWRHRERIEEWTDLAPQARAALFESLTRVALAGEADQPAWEFKDGLYSENWAGVRLPLAGNRGVHIGVYWAPDASNSRRGYWPEFAISASPPNTFPEYAAIKAHLGPVAAKYGMTRNAKGNFLWFGAVPLRSELSIDEFATATLATVKSAHAELLPPTTAFFLEER
jgi:hypothetical protein